MVGTLPGACASRAGPEFQTPLARGNGWHSATLTFRNEKCKFQTPLARGNGWHGAYFTSAGQKYTGFKPL